MKILFTAIAIASTLLWNVAYASSEQEITCKTGFFSTKTLIIKRDSRLQNDFPNPIVNEGDVDLSVFRDEEEVALHDYYDSHLLSDSRKSLNTSSKYFPHQDGGNSQSFKWQEGDLKYQLWDSSRGWAIRIDEKDWSSSEGDHYDKVLDKTYCTASD